MLNVRIMAVLQGMLLAMSFSLMCRIFAFRGMWLSEAVSCSFFLLMAAQVPTAIKSVGRLFLRRRYALVACGGIACFGFLFSHVESELSPAALAVWALVLSALVWLSVSERRLPFSIAIGVISGAILVNISDVSKVRIDYLMLVCGTILFLAKLAAPKQDLKADSTSNKRTGEDAEGTELCKTNSLRSILQHSYFLLTAVALGLVIWSLQRQVAVACRSGFSASGWFVSCSAAGVLAALLASVKFPIRRPFTPFIPLAVVSIGVLSTHSITFYRDLVFSEMSILQTSASYLTLSRFFPVPVMIFLCGFLCTHFLLRSRSFNGFRGLSLEACFYVIIVTSFLCALVGSGTIADPDKVKVLAVGLGFRAILLSASCLAACALGFFVFKPAKADLIPNIMSASAILILLVFVSSADPVWRLLPSRDAYLNYLQLSPYRVLYGPLTDDTPGRHYRQVKPDAVTILPDGVLAGLSSADGPSLKLFGGAVLSSSEGRSQGAERLMAHLPFLVCRKRPNVGIMKPCSKLILEGLQKHVGVLKQQEEGPEGDDYGFKSFEKEAGVALSGTTGLRGIIRPGNMLLDAILIGPAAISLRVDSSSIVSRQGVIWLAMNLAPRGSLIYWLPTRGVSPDDLGRIIATIQSVLPEIHVFMVSDDIVLIAGRSPLKINWEHASRIWKAAEVQGYMGKAGYWNLISVLSELCVSPFGAKRIAGKADTISFLEPATPGVGRDLGEISRAECMTLLWQYREAAKLAVRDVFEFPNKSEEDFFWKRFQKSHNSVTSRLLRTITRLSRFREKEFINFVGSELLDSEMFGGAPDIHPLMKQAVAFEYMRFHVKALTPLNRLVKEGKADADVFVHMAVNYELLGKAKEAREYYETALKYSEDYPPALRGLARLARLIGDHKSVVKYLEASLRKEPESISDMVKLSRAYGTLGNYKKAAAMLRRVLEIDPENADALEGLPLYSREGER